MTIVGALAFGDFIFEPWNAAGLVVGMTGALWFATRSALKVQAQQQQAAQAQQQQAAQAQQRVEATRLLAIINEPNVRSPRQ